MNERVLRLRERLRNGEHAAHRMFLPDEWNTSGEPFSLCERKALAVKLVAQNMPIFIEDGEILVGSKTVYGRVPEVEESNKHRVNLLCFPKYATEKEKAEIGGVEGMQKNHALPAYRIPLERGLDGMRRDIEKRMADAGVTQAQKEFLSSAKIAVDSVSLLADRYASLAQALSEAETESQARKEELLEIGRVCRKIAREKPETLQEAMQLYLFVYFVMLIEQGSSVGFGRVDQLFLPYADDLDEEKLDELIACFLLKLNDVADVDLGDLRYNGEDSIVLCGVKPDGSDATNDLSYRFLRIFGEMHVSAPMPCIRVASTTPDDIVETVCRLNLDGINSSALFNDDAFVKALNGAGIPIEYARSWALDLCQDVQIDGASDMFIGAQFSLLEPILRALRESDDGITWNDFYDKVKGFVADDLKRQLPEVAAYEDCALRWPEDRLSFDKAIREGILPDPPRNTFFGSITHMLSPYPVYSAFMEGCLENARDITHGGAKFRHKGVFGLVPTNSINSLTAIRHCAFLKKTLTLTEIREAIERNFEGMEDRRLLLYNAPKWGNDDDECDMLAKDYIEWALKEVGRYSLSGGQKFLSGVHQPHTQAAGRNYAATPDGRFAREPVPVTISPTNGTDTNGPTAVMNSVAKLDPMLQQWNAALTLSFDGSGDGETKARKARTLAALIRGYFDKGGMEFQPNAVSPGELLDAQAHPEKHRDLLVRVWGVSMYFVELSRDWQNEIIARTLHKIA